MQIPRTNSSIRDAAAISKSKTSIMSLWDTLGGNISSLPDSYSEQFSYEFADGDVSLLNTLSRVDSIDDLSREEFSELVDRFVKVDPEDWPEPEAIEEIIYERLFENPVENFSEVSLDFEEGDPEKFGENVERMLRAVISTVYRDGVARVVDIKGNPPSKKNNFLLTEDGHTFEGVFITFPKGKKRDKFKFRISERGEGKWRIVY